MWSDEVQPLSLFKQKINRMTNYERHVFSELLDVNYEISTGNHNSLIKSVLLNRYSLLVAQLEDSMGTAAWREFGAVGKKMFAPKGGYGDESPEEVERMMSEVN